MPGSELGLLFIDIAGDSVAPAQISRAIQNSPLARVRYLLFRWPHVGISPTGSTERVAAAERIRTWLQQVDSMESVALFSPKHLGVVQFNVGEAPDVYWAAEPPPDAQTERTLLDRALRAEFRALLDWGHAVWRPKRYHYVLPSGTHSDVFVKVADSFRTPQDVRVMATWLVDRLSDEMTIIADTADLIPLIIYLRNMAHSRGWQAIESAVLDEYPRTRADLATALRGGRRSAKALLLLSVNASGTYRDVMCDIARSIYRSATDWSMVVLVDKTRQATRSGFYTADGEEITTWYGLAIPPLKSPHTSSECSLCVDSERSQVVLIDPRTFEAVALPGANLIMPDTAAARSTRVFWTACSNSGSVQVLSAPAESPSIAAREKDGLMNLKIDTETLWQSDGFLQALTDQLNSYPPDQAARFHAGQTDCIVVSSFDRALPHFDDVIRLVRETFSVPQGAPVIEVHELGRALSELGQFRKPLIFSAGAVTGWNLRQLLITVQESWESQPSAGDASCLVVHARPATVRQWENISSSFEGRMMAIWKSLIPAASPLREEADLLSELEPTDLTTTAQQFRDERLKVCNPPQGMSWNERLAGIGAGEPDPRSVLWGISADTQQRVRNESLYGTRVDAITAYAAVGAAMQSARQQSGRTEPRWPMFDFDSISRSYYDGIIVASILRWSSAGESYWGANARDQRASISGLVKRTTRLADQTVLFPELMLAAAQGKIPRAGVNELVELVQAIAADWPSHIPRGPLELGVALVKTQIF